MELVTQVGFTHPGEADQLSAPQQFVAVAGGQFPQALSKHGHEFQPPLQGWLIGGEPSENPGGVLVHGLLEAKKSLSGPQIVGVHLRIGAGTLVFIEGYQGLPNLILSGFDDPFVTVGGLDCSKA